ncbi:MAG: hypothetical protein O9972_35555, partial [Burkholderiales bacterium]|nr:hypothetical protein [Burkholderiales bacterium]
MQALADGVEVHAAAAVYANGTGATRPDRRAGRPGLTTPGPRWAWTPGPRAGRPHQVSMQGRFLPVRAGRGGAA